MSEMVVVFKAVAVLHRVYTRNEHIYREIKALLCYSSCLKLECLQVTNGTWRELVLGQL